MRLHQPVQSRDTLRAPIPLSGTVYKVLLIAALLGVVLIGSWVLFRPAEYRRENQAHAQPPQLIPSIWERQNAMRNRSKIGEGE